MTIREFLRRHYEMNRSIDTKLELLEELKGLASKITTGTYSESRGGGGYTDRVGRTTARIIDLENEINEEIDKLVDMQLKIRELILSLSDPVQQTLMERHYILHESWDKISEKMGYTPRHIHRLHNLALDELEKRRSAAGDNHNSFPQAG